VARFDMVDQKQLQKLRSGSGDAGQAALDQFTDTFTKRIEEVRTAKNCKAN
jgi:hypothetical protein